MCTWFEATVASSISMSCMSSSEHRFGNSLVASEPQALGRSKSDPASQTFHRHRGVAAAPRPMKLPAGCVLQVNPNALPSRTHTDPADRLQWVHQERRGSHALRSARQGEIHGDGSFHFHRLAVKEIWLVAPL